jgi:hypothetical protein
MDSFIASCRDMDRLAQILVVDDNSTSEDRARMKERYPGFRFVFKEPGEAGHARSMNVILDEVRTGRVLHIEDDWHFPHPFRVEDLLAILELQDDIIQVLLCGRPGLVSRVAPGGDAWLEYVYNPDHECRTEDLEALDAARHRAMGLPPRAPDRPRSADGWWWPGFSLNPALWRIDVVRDRIGRFGEDVPPGDFEADFALRVHHHPMRTRIAVHDLGVRHLGRDVSAYAINEQSRPWDGDSDGKTVEGRWVARWKRASEMLAGDPARAVGALLEIWNERPRRGEPLWDLVQHYHRRDHHAVVCLLAGEGSRLERPDDAIGVLDDIYEWRFLDMLCTHLFYLGMYDEGLRCFTLLERRDVPDREKERLARNRRFYVEALGRG